MKTFFNELKKQWKANPKEFIESVIFLATLSVLGFILLKIFGE
jgi:hypothetical protein